MIATDILMYHSIGDGPGPLSIPPAVFRSQLDLLAETGRRGVALREYVKAIATGAPLQGAAVLTFDDGYRDFADVVVPELERRGWRATVFLPSGMVGSRDWDPDGRGARPLLEWSDARTFEQRGIEIGAHSVNHADLTTLALDGARKEIVDCKATIEQEAGCRVTTFAAPYGHTTSAIRKEIARHYEAAVGATLAQATGTSDRFNLPRIEMWYFRSPDKWRAYLEGARTYFSTRRILRGAKAAAMMMSMGKPRRRE